MSSMPSLAAGDRFSSGGEKLEFQRVLGRGAFGEVWKCLDLGSKDSRAVKVIRSEDSEDRRIIDEVSAMRHALSVLPPDRVPGLFFAAAGEVVSEDGEAKGEVFGIVMQFIDGCTLAEALEKNGPLPYWSSAPLYHDILTALVEVHRVGMVHRDVKSANIMFNRKGEAFLCDFGSTLFLADVRDDEPMEVVGTPLYMAPEVVDTIPTKYDEKVDVFSLGIVGYEMLMGFTPWRRDGQDLPIELIYKELRLRMDLSDRLDLMEAPGLDLQFKPFRRYLDKVLNFVPEYRPNFRDQMATGPFKHSYMSKRKALGELVV